MSNSDIENKVYFGVHSDNSVVTDMLTMLIRNGNFVTARKIADSYDLELKCKHILYRNGLQFSSNKNSIFQMRRM